jgi:2-phosphosulfolactate phosphatase
MVVTTTNGTSAINIAKKDHDVVIGSFLNISALAAYLNNQDRDVIILCAGWKGDFCLEDTLFAGALSKLLIEESDFKGSFDTTQSSMLIYEQAKNDLFKFLDNSQHRNRLAHLNILEDVRYCLLQNTTTIIPKAIGKELVALS